MTTMRMAMMTTITMAIFGIGVAGCRTGGDNNNGGNVGGVGDSNEYK